MLETSPQASTAPHRCEKTDHVSELLLTSEQNMCLTICALLLTAGQRRRRRHDHRVHRLQPTCYCFPVSTMSAVKPYIIASVVTSSHSLPHEGCHPAAEPNSIMLDTTAGEQRPPPAPHPRQGQNRRLAQRRSQLRRTASGARCQHRRRRHRLQPLPPVRSSPGNTAPPVTSTHDLRKTHAFTGRAVESLACWCCCSCASGDDISRCCAQTLVSSILPIPPLASATGAAGCPHGTALRPGASALAPAKRCVDCKHVQLQRMSSTNNVPLCSGHGLTGLHHVYRLTTTQQSTS
jgi:hypothetical protein